MSQPKVTLPKLRMVRGRGGGIRITNIQTIRPPDPELLKQQEEKQLRAQLQREIVSRSKSCGNKSYECHLPVVTGRQFCARHILQDPSAPYRACAHAAGGARCARPAPAPAPCARPAPAPAPCARPAPAPAPCARPAPAPAPCARPAPAPAPCARPAPAPAPAAPAQAGDARDRGLCYQHARAGMLARARGAAPPAPVTTTETLMHQLSHYVRGERARTSSCASAVSVVSEPDVDSEPTHLDPFKQIDATAVNAAYSASILECCSASDSDADSVTLGPPYEDALSDYEDAPVEDEPLWRAGVYTAEEAVSEAKNALVSLQSAYIRQMTRLRQLLQTARLKYLRDLKAEKELYCSINAQSRSGPLTVRERRQLRKLKAYAGYRRAHTVHAVLARKLQRKRARTYDTSQRGAVRCSFAEAGAEARCCARAAPAAKHCLKHIVHDTQQVLFSACADPRGLWPCREPVARLPLPSAACRHHTMPPAYTVFTLKKDDSDSDDSHCSSEA